MEDIVLGKELMMVLQLEKLSKIITQQIKVIQFGQNI